MRYTGRLAAVIAISAATVVQAAPSSTESARLSGFDIFKLASADDAQISPDGRFVAYVRVQADIATDKNRSTIVLIDTRLDKEATVAVDATSPRWSPDGKFLAYSSKADGQSRLMVWNATDRTTWSVASLSNVPPAISWSPDGSEIAYAAFVEDPAAQIGEQLVKPPEAKWARPLEVVDYTYHAFDEIGDVRPGFTRIFVVSRGGGQSRQVTSGDFDVRGPKRPGAVIEWTHDGAALLVSGKQGKGWEFNPHQTEIYRFSVADGGVVQLTHRDGPDLNPIMSPDGRHIAYLGADMRRVGFQNSRLHVMDADGKNSRIITGNLDLSIDDFAWSADGRSILAQANDRAISKVFEIGLDGSSREIVAGLGGGLPTVPYTVASRAFSVSNNGSIAYVDAVADRPGEVVIAERGKSRQLTRSNASFLETRQIGKIIRLPVKSSVDGKDVATWIVTPPGYQQGKRYPAILEIHGGPYASYGPFFSMDHQLYAAAGYVVIYPNFRGSTSYGEAFAQLNQGAFPGDDYLDDMSAVESAISAGYVDPDRLYITGGSNGGLVTAWAVGQSNRFKAAAAQKPVTDWFSLTLTTDRYTDMPQDWFGKLPWEDPMAYYKRSPISRVGQIKTPTLVLIGTEDKRTPPSQSEELFHALKLQGVPTALVRIPGGNHGGMSPSQSAARVNTILGWFARYPGQ